MSRRRGLLPLACALASTNVTGLRLSTVGLLLSAAAIASLPVPLVVGHLADRTRPLDRVLLAQVMQGAACRGLEAWRYAPLSNALSAAGAVFRRARRAVAGAGAGGARDRRHSDHGRVAPAT